MPCTARHGEYEAGDLDQPHITRLANRARLCGKEIRAREDPRVLIESCFAPCSKRLLACRDCHADYGKDGQPEK